MTMAASCHSFHLVIVEVVYNKHSMEFKELNMMY